MKAYVVEYALVSSIDGVDGYYPIWDNKEDAKDFCEARGLDFDKIKEIEV